MKYLLLLLCFPFLAASDCNKKKIPACINKVIEENKNATTAPAVTQVDEYSYNGKTVYLFTAPCCDQYNTLYDENCNAICSPTGGITGKGDGKCEDFSKTATFVKLIWKSTPQ